MNDTIETFGNNDQEVMASAVGGVARKFDQDQWLQIEETVDAFGRQVIDAQTKTGVAFAHGHGAGTYVDNVAQKKYCLSS